MLINIDETLINQDKINFFSFSTYTDKGYAGTYLTIDMCENHEQHLYEIKYLRNKDSGVICKELKSLRSFLCDYFGKRGIELTLYDPNKIGMDIYD